MRDTGALIDERPRLLSRGLRDTMKGCGAFCDASHSCCCEKIVFPFEATLPELVRTTPTDLNVELH